MGGGGRGATLYQHKIGKFFSYFIATLKKKIKIVFFYKNLTENLIATLGKVIILLQYLIKNYNSKSKKYKISEFKVPQLLNEYLICHHLPVLNKYGLCPSEIIQK